MTNEWLGIGEGALLDAAKGAAAGSVVPGIGTAVGGLVGLAGGLIARTMAPDTAPALAAAATAITGRADELGQVAAIGADPQAAADFKAEALRIAADREARDAAATIAALQARLADTSNARAQTQALAISGSRIAWAAPVLSVLVLVSFDGLAAVVLFHGVPAGSDPLANTLLGTLGAMAVGVVQVPGPAAAPARRGKPRLRRRTAPRRPYDAGRCRRHPARPRGRAGCANCRLYLRPSGFLPASRGVGRAAY